MTVSLLIISFSWTMIFSISVWTSSSFNSVPLLQIAQRRQHAEQIAALTEEIEELRSRQAMILHSLDCKNDGEAQRFGSYPTSRKKCRSGWRHREKALHSSFPSTQNSTLKSRIFPAPLNRRTFLTAITKIPDKSPAAASFTKAAAVIKVSILRIFRPSCRQNRRCRYSTRWNCRCA